MKMTLIKIVPFVIHHQVSEAQIESMMNLLKDKVRGSYDKDEARSIAIREILEPIVEMNIEFDWEEVK